MTESTIEHDEYLRVWSLDEGSALACFGMTRAEHEICVLQDGPMTEHERGRYRPDAKLFGICRRPAVDPATAYSPDADSDAPAKVGA